MRTRLQGAEPTSGLEGGKGARKEQTAFSSSEFHGEWKTIERFLKHIFSAKNIKGESLFNFGMDYLQFTYLLPQKRLPVICLVSNERNTGKSDQFLRYHITVYLFLIYVLKRIQ